MEIKIQKLNKDAIIPNYATPGSSGFDFHALEKTIVRPGETIAVSTGLSFEIPQGYELQIRPRSGLSLKTKARIANSPGTVDSDYRKEVKILIENIADNDPMNGSNLVFEKNDRIAQGVIAPTIRVSFEESEVKQTGRGGFGSTGRNI